MSVIWSGVTEEGAVVPVQVDETGKVIATAAVPGGDYVKKTGDNMTGDLTLGTDNITLDAGDGSASFASFVRTQGDVLDVAGAETGAGMYGGSGFAAAWNQDSSPLYRGYRTGAITPTFEVKVDGRATFAGSCTFANSFTWGPDAEPGIRLDAYSSYSSIAVKNPSTYISAAFQVLSDGYGPSSVKIDLNNDGSSTFAGGSCGFTSSGELFFTSRNARYKLVVQDQLVLAEPYTRQMELKEKAEQFIADKRETKPSDPQGGVSMDIDNSSPNRD